MIHRRSLLLGLVSSLAAPALVRASSLDGLDVLRRTALDPKVLAFWNPGMKFWGASIFNEFNPLRIEEWRRYQTGSLPERLRALQERSVARGNQQEYSLMRRSELENQPIFRNSRNGLEYFRLCARPSTEFSIRNSHRHTEGRQS